MGYVLFDFPSSSFLVPKLSIPSSRGSPSKLLAWNLLNSEFSDLDNNGLAGSLFLGERKHLAFQGLFSWGLPIGNSGQ